ncbi:MAG: DUF4149 domain-containing protein [Verrucomicrobiota bacterium]|nr:DUF4149 domain-containing protein [Verrucomicrobiota bacterium]
MFLRLGRAGYFSHPPEVAAFLRLIGILNAAVWLGAIVFFTLLVGPAFFSNEMQQLLGKPHAGAAAQIILERYFILQQWCAGIALSHLIADRLYTGKSLHKLTLFLLMGLFAIGVVGGNLLYPKMKQLHLIKYAVQTTPEQKSAAARSFSILHGLSQAVNLLVLGSVLYYSWQTVNSGRPTLRRPLAGTGFV